MSADFIPFLQTLNSRLSSGQSSFAPLPQGTAPSTSGPTAAPAHTHRPAGEVKVELKRDGDRITQIRIHCRCGELIELNCDYA